MRGKATLTLMEQLVMLLVFALAAALCLQAFVWADSHSRQNSARDKAVQLAQSAAETIRHAGGDADHALAAAAAELGTVYGAFAGEGAALEVHYDADWAVSDTREYAFCLRVQEADSETPGLCKAHVSVLETKTGKPLFELDIAWQEVDGHG